MHQKYWACKKYNKYTHKARNNNTKHKMRLQVSNDLHVGRKIILLNLLNLVEINIKKIWKLKN